MGAGATAEEVPNSPRPYRKLLNPGEGWRNGHVWRPATGRFPLATHMYGKCCVSIRRNQYLVLNFILGLTSIQNKPTEILIISTVVVVLLIIS